MAQYTIKNAIETAIQAEDLGSSYYTGLASKFRDKTELKEIFELLALDEIQHKNYFKELLNQASEKAIELSDYDTIYLQGVNLRKFFKDLENYTQEIKPYEVLNIVLEFEKDSVLFYSHINELFGHNKILNEIIKSEKQHFVRLWKYLITESKFRGIEDKWE